MVDKKTQGKQNRVKGSAFELRVRKALEKSWIVDKWSNNVELFKPKFKETKQMMDDRELPSGKLIPARRKFNPFKKVLGIGTGFPDFIAYKAMGTIGRFVYKIIGVEAKSSGYLDPKEREKCRWLLDNYIFSKILIASKGTKRGQIVYKEFDTKI